MIGVWREKSACKSCWIAQSGTLILISQFPLREGPSNNDNTRSLLNDHWIIYEEKDLNKQQPDLERNEMRTVKHEALVSFLLTPSSLLFCPRTTSTSSSSFTISFGCRHFPCFSSPPSISKASSTQSDHSCCNGNSSDQSPTQTSETAGCTPTS
jgi:hypothetical protein